MDDLGPKDQFNLVCFNEEATQWKPSLVPASAENMKEARNFAAGIMARGGESLCSPVGWGLLGYRAQPGASDWELS